MSAGRSLQASFVWHSLSRRGRIEVRDGRLGYSSLLGLLVSMITMVRVSAVTTRSCALLPLMSFLAADFDGRHLEASLRNLKAEHPSPGNRDSEIEPLVRNSLPSNVGRACR